MTMTDGFAKSPSAGNALAVAVQLQKYSQVRRSFFGGLTSWETLVSFI